MIRVNKFGSIFEAQLFLRGGLIGAKINGGTYNLVGKTIQFERPVMATVTFVAGTGPDPYLLTFQDIKAQVEAAIAGILVVSLDGKICFVESTPSGGVKVTGVGTGVTLLGFSASGATEGFVYNSPFDNPPVVPYFMQACVSPDNSHVIYTQEA